MPANYCDYNGKWSWGRGECIYDSKSEAEKVGITQLIERQNKLKEKINNEWKRYGNKN
jgi:hypothetical protein